jgi:dihydroorotase
VSKLSAGSVLQTTPVSFNRRFVMRDGRLVTDAAGWGRSVKERQQMPPARPRNTDLSTAAILVTPPGVPPNALPVPEAQR